MADKKKIKILPGGPYEVDAGVPLKQAIIGTDDRGGSERWDEGREYTKHPGAPGKPYHLCRCGNSKNKPYCDGSHVSTGFEGTEKNNRESYLSGCTVYEGPEVDLYDNESLCAGVRFCECGKDTWDCVEDSANPASLMKAVEQTGACASGRLTLRRKDGSFVEPELEPEVNLVEDTALGWRGPLWVKGNIELEGADGKTYETRNRMTLCRCGNSKNMPFCDRTHMKCSHMEGFDE